MASPCQCGFKRKIYSLADIFVNFVKKKSSGIILNRNRIQRRYAISDQVCVHKVMATSYFWKVVQCKSCFTGSIGACNNIANWFSVFHFHSPLNLILREDSKNSCVCYTYSEKKSIRFMKHGENTGFGQARGVPLRGGGLGDIC